MSYRIITDTCCDFPEHMYAELQLTAVPLTVNYKNKSVNSYSEQWLKDMFDGLRAGEEATTSAANPQDWENAMEPALQAGDDLLVLAFSSGLSTTYQSAVIAAEELKEFDKGMRPEGELAEDELEAVAGGYPLCLSGTGSFSLLRLPEAGRRYVFGRTDSMV